MKGVLTVDELNKPIYVSRLIGEPSRAQVDLYFLRLEGILRQGTPYAMINDISNADTNANAAYKAAYGDFMMKQRAALDRLLIAAYVVAPTVATRTAMRAFFLFTPPPGAKPVVCASMDEALGAAREFMAGIRAPIAL